MEYFCTQSSNSVITTRKKDFETHWISRNSEDKVPDEKLHLLDKNIQNRVIKCNDCNSAAKSPSISYHQAWPSTDKP